MGLEHSAVVLHHTRLLLDDMCHQIAKDQCLGFSKL
jgi:hypothetical protein